MEVGCGGGVLDFECLCSDNGYILWVCIKLNIIM